MSNLPNLIYKLFRGRRDTFAVQRVKRNGEVFYYRTEKELTGDILHRHLTGEEVIGIYPLLGKRCYFAAIDIDKPDLELARKVQKLVPAPNYLERSRSGNYHIWMFFKEAVQVNTLEAVCKEAVSYVKETLKEHCGLYPLPSEGIGLLIALPLQAQIVNNGLSVFVDEQGDPMADIEQNTTFLNKVKYAKLPSVEDLKLRDLWLGAGKTWGDTSRSGYDFSFAQLLFHRGYEREKVKRALLSRPPDKIHSTDDAYIERTLDRASKAIESRTVPSLSWDDIEPLKREDFFNAMKEKLVMGGIQRQQFDFFYATMVANLKTSGRPIWLLMIGPPGCGKTLSMVAIQHSPFTYAISSFRPTALISGWGVRGGQDMSLIPKLNGKVLLVKDLSSLLSQNRDTVVEVLGLLRDAYDGFCSRAYGTGIGVKSYKSRFGFIGATTPDIDLHWGVNVRLGERFLRFRIESSLDQVYGKIDRSLQNLSEEDSVDNSTEELSLRYLKYLSDENKSLPPLSNVKEIGRLAQLGAILRTAVPRNQYTRQVMSLPVWEEATRYAKQLAKMAISLAYIREKPTNDTEELKDLKLLVRSGMSSKAEKICSVIYKRPGATTSQIAEELGTPSNVARAGLDDLNVSRIVSPEYDSYDMRWKFAPFISGQLTHFKLWD